MFVRKLSLLFGALVLMMIQTCVQCWLVHRMRPLRAVKRSAVSLLIAGIGIFISPHVPPAEATEALTAAMSAMNSKSYSNNVKNFQRMAEGDFSQGFKDISTSDAAKKRRAVKYCRIEKYHDLAGLSEHDCVEKTIKGDIQFMLDIIAKEQGVAQ